MVAFLESHKVMSSIACKCQKSPSSKSKGISSESSNALLPLGMNTLQLVQARWKHSIIAAFCSCSEFSFLFSRRVICRSSVLPLRTAWAAFPVRLEWSCTSKRQTFSSRSRFDDLSSQLHAINWWKQSCGPVIYSIGICWYMEKDRDTCMSCSTFHLGFEDNWIKMYSSAALHAR